MFIIYDFLPFFLSMWSLLICFDLSCFPNICDDFNILFHSWESPSSRHLWIKWRQCWYCSFDLSNWTQIKLSLCSWWPLDSLLKHSQIKFRWSAFAAGVSYNMKHMGNLQARSASFDPALIKDFLRMKYNNQKFRQR